MLVLGVLVFLAAISNADAASGHIQDAVVVCTGMPDGVAEIGCDGYIECVNGQMVKHLCEPSEVFDRDTMSCIHDHGTHGCSEHNVCVHLEDGRYPGADCKTYYTCHGHHFLGHTYCPGDLVFSEAMQLCDWSWNVPPPCGTMV